MTSLQIKLNDAVYKKIEELAQFSHVDVEQWVESAIEEKTKNSEKSKYGWAYREDMKFSAEKDLAENHDRYLY